MELPYEAGEEEFGILFQSPVLLQHMPRLGTALPDLAGEGDEMALYGVEARFRLLTPFSRAGQANRRNRPPDRLVGRQFSAVAA